MRSLILPAFPSVGCGKLGFDPAIIAQHMIDETQAQLLKMGNQLHVSFVLLADQKNVYDEFVKYLNASKSSSASASIAPTTSNGLTKMSYDEKGNTSAFISPIARLTHCSSDGGYIEQH